jgi:inositol phosphorylceramide synthase catalytic subunit
VNAPGAFWRHLWRVWPRRPLGPFLPLVPFVLYALYSFARHDLRLDHLAILAVVATLAWIGPRTKELLLGLYPIGLVFLLYDGMRPFQKLGLTPSRVLLCDLRAFEARFFGADGATVHDYFQAHPSLALDLLCAIPYSTFILWSIAGGIFLYVRDRPAMKRFMWGFFAMNVAGFVTYHVLPAAPPWYFHSYGCVVDLATKANEGPALARVDTFLGVGYFHGMYGKASSVFGALPSLHCAYPLLLLIEGWRAFGTKLRTFAVLYWGAMVFSAVYLDHHWVVDAILGSSYAVVVAVFMRLVERLRGARGFPTRELAA